MNRQVAITPADGLLWAHFGFERMAVAVEARAHKFFKRGILNRCERLAGRYLNGMATIYPGDMIINFGANIGELAAVFADVGASVIAIEPDPNVLPALYANAERRQITVIPAAAWHLDGELEMYIASDTADTSAFNPSSDKRMLPCLTIDGIVAGQEIDRVRLIVGDAEGAEPEVLAGAFQTLAITDYVSVCASAERCGATTLDACQKILADAGFDIIHREDDGFCTLIARNRSAKS